LQQHVCSHHLHASCLYTSSHGKALADPRYLRTGPVLELSCSAAPAVTVPE
jgi:hypothetical protein